MSGVKQEQYKDTKQLDGGGALSGEVTENADHEAVKGSEDAGRTGSKSKTKADRDKGQDSAKTNGATTRPKKECSPNKPKLDRRIIIGCVALLVAAAALGYLALQSKFNGDYFKFPQSTKVDVGVKFMNGYAYLDKLGVMRALEQEKMTDEALEEKYSEQFKDNVTVVDGVDCVDLTRVFDVTGKIFYIKTEGDQDLVFMQEFMGDSLSAEEMDEFISQCKASKLNLAESIFYLGVVKNISIGSGTFLDSIIILGDNITDDGGLSNYSELYGSLVSLHEISIQLKEQQDNDVYSSTYDLYVEAVNDFNAQYVRSLQESKNMPDEIKALMADETGHISGNSLSYEDTLQYLWDNRERTDTSFAEIVPAPELKGIVKSLGVIARTNNLRVDNEHMPSIIEIKEFEIALDLFNKSLEADPMIQTYWERFDAIEQGLTVDMPEKPKVASTVEYLGSDARIDFPDVTHLGAVECLKVTNADMIGDEVQNVNNLYYLSLEDANEYFETEFVREDVERVVHEEGGKVYVSLDSACELWGYTFFIGDDNLLYFQEGARAYTTERLEELIELFTGQPLPLALFYIGMDGNLPAENSPEFLDFVSRLGTFTYTKEYEELVNSMIDYTMCNVYASTYNYNLEGKDFQTEQQDSLKRYYHELYKGLLSDKVLPYLPQYAADLLLCRDVEIGADMTDEEVVMAVREMVFASDYDGLTQLKATEGTKTLLQSILYSFESQSKMNQYPSVAFPKNEDASKSILSLILFYDTFTTVENFGEIW